MVQNTVNLLPKEKHIPIDVSQMTTFMWENIWPSRQTGYLRKRNLMDGPKNGCIRKLRKTQTLWRNSCTGIALLKNGESKLTINIDI